MDLTLAGQIVVALLGAISAGVPLIGNRAAGRDLRNNLRADISILTDLPSESTRRDALLVHIDASVDRLIADQERHRNPFGIGSALAVILVAVVVGILVIRTGGWWLLALIPVLFLFVVGSAGLAQESSRLKRDNDGNPLPS